MPDWIFGLEVMLFYGLILGLAGWELWKTMKLTDKNKAEKSDESEPPKS